MQRRSILLHSSNRNLQPITADARKLFFQGAVVLAEIESHGMRIDIDWCKKQQEVLTERIKELQADILNHELGKLWRKKYAERMSLDSNQQLADILYNHMGFEPVKYTASGNPAVDKEVLHKLQKELPILEKLLLYRKLRKARDTYLKNLIAEAPDGWLHPFFNLHTVRTYRSSSSNPNFQNIPTRDPEIGEIIRRAFIPRGPDYMFGGIDYGSQEVRIAACYHKDPNMINYISTGGDMHKDVASMCYMCSPEQVSKNMRKVAKNKFTFPQFYGDYYRNCARALWEEMEERHLQLSDGTDLKQWLASKGIKTYEQFEEHIRKVEEKFWGEMFPVYAQWKEKWYTAYQKKGYFDLLTGFRCQGVMRRNDVINYPVQGAAFHCLLWSLIKLHVWLVKNKLKTKIVGQIHDEIVMDLHVKEKDYVLEKVVQVMEKDIRRHWQWIIVPLEAEAEFCEPGETWFDKKEIDLSHLKG